MITIYTDGAYSSSRNQGGWSYVAIKDGKKIGFDFMGVLDTTNNQMEILAVIEACKAAKEMNESEITIISDSMYVIGTMTKGWQKKKNLDLWEQMDLAVQGLNITWVHVKGHSNNLYNELCDVLAVEASHAKLI